ncbi:MAG TPA: outer membrane beta-barrel protein, partial [Chryseosolibacter sp.]|nr:outer membrane beta-barrel protein [Chryseosolibacter sp.]
KRRLLFFQMLAAASVVFAMAIGGIGYYYSFHADRSGANMLAQDKAVVNEPTSDEVTLNDPATEAEERYEEDVRTDDPSITSQNERIGGTAQRSAANNDGRLERSSVQHADGPSRDQRNYNPPTNGESSDKSQLLISQSAEESFEDLPLAIKDRQLEPLHTPRQVRLNFENKTEEVDPVVAMMARLAQREQEVQDDDSRKNEEGMNDENLWTSIGFAAGSFNSVQASAASPSPSRNMALASFAAPIVEQEAKANGYSYSMGVNIGTRLSERWVFQGGLNYMTQASEYISNNIVMDAPAGYLTQQKFRAASTNELMMADASDLRQKLVYSAPYSVNNSMRFLSIPMQAGYQLINKTFGLQLNAGVATDLFLQNTISAESDQIAKTSQPVGADSPYRAVNLSGLFGTEVSYRFGDHYRVSLNPGIRYPFNTIYKSELGVRSTPLTFDVGLRFRYIFK